MAPPRRAWIALALLVAYLGLELAFDHETEALGLFSPGGAPHDGVLALGASYFVLRLAVYFALPAAVAYGLARSVVARHRFRRGP